VSVEQSLRHLFDFLNLFVSGRKDDEKEEEEESPAQPGKYSNQAPK
jgi:hypothetical protein